MGLQYRNPQAARQIIAELTLKAASRLRNRQLYAKYIGLRIYTANRQLLKKQIKMPACNDSQTICRHLLKIFDSFISSDSKTQIYKISVSLSELITEPQQLSFDQMGNLKKMQTLSSTMDLINKKYHKNLISLGMPPKASKEDVIVFGYVPEVE